MLQEELIIVEGRERNLLGRLDAITTVVAGPTDVTGAAVVARAVIFWLFQFSFESVRLCQSLVVSN